MNKYKCIHSHLLPNIDDGTSSYEESVKLIKKLELLGFDEIVITPHFMEGTNYIANNEKKNHIMNILKHKLLENNISTKIYLGNEIFIFEDILSNIKNGNISTINNSRYLLIEFPMKMYFPTFINGLKKLINIGYIPIIAHPERYSVFQENPNKILDLTKEGILFQSNYGSIIGYYGSKVEMCLKELLKLSAITFLSTDLHCDSDIISEFNSIKQSFINLIGEEKFNKLSNINIKKVIDNEVI